MRLSRSHQLVAATVTAIIATSAVVTFSRADTATPPSSQIAALPEADAGDAPTVAGRSPGTAAKRAKATDKPPATADTAPAPTTSTRVRARTALRPSPGPTTPRPRDPAPEPAPSPTRTPKNIIEILLGR